MKTKLTSKNINAKNINNAFTNPFGFKMENTQEVRTAVANHAHDLLRKLQGKG